MRMAGYLNAVAWIMFLTGCALLNKDFRIGFWLVGFAGGVWVRDFDQGE